MTQPVYLSDPRPTTPADRDGVRLGGSHRNFITMLRVRPRTRRHPSLLDGRYLGLRSVLQKRSAR